MHLKRLRGDGAQIAVYQSKIGVVGMERGLSQTLLFPSI
jgi:hypothetical protein